MKKIVVLFTAVVFAITLGVAFADQHGAAPVAAPETQEKQAEQMKEKTKIQKKKAATKAKKQAPESKQDAKEAVQEVKAESHEAAKPAN